MRPWKMVVFLVLVATDLTLYSAMICSGLLAGLQPRAR